MDCDAFRDEMMDLLSRQAAPTAARRLEEHQAACGSCREELASFRRLRADLSALAGSRRPRPAPPAPRWAPLPGSVAAALGPSRGRAGGCAAPSCATSRVRFSFRLAGPGAPTSRPPWPPRSSATGRKWRSCGARSCRRRSGEEQTLRRVQQWIAESEARQAALVATGLTRLGGSARRPAASTTSPRSQRRPQLPRRQGRPAGRARTTELDGPTCCRPRRGSDHASRPQRRRVAASLLAPAAASAQATSDTTRTEMDGFAAAPGAAAVRKV